MKQPKNNLKILLLGLLMLPLFMAIFFSLLKLFSPSIINFPSVLEIYSDFVKSFFDKRVISAILSTAKYVLISSIISIVIGVLLSFILNVNKWIWSIVEPTIDFFRSIPVTFFIPAFAIILGISSPNIVWILAVIPSTLIILVNVAYGIKEQEKPEKQNRLHQYYLLAGNSNRIRAFKKVTFYEVLPYFITGFKVALSYAIVIVTVLEYMQIGNEIGLGRLVYDEMEQLNYERVYSLIMIVGLIGYILNYIIQNGNKIYRKVKLLKVRLNENR